MSDSTQKRSAYIFSRRIVVRLCFGVACLLTLVAIFYTIENWRGKRAWESCRTELVAKGVKLDWHAYVPAPVPDNQNIFKAPKIAEWFVKTDRNGGFSNQLSARWGAMTDCIGRRNTNVIAQVTVVPLEAEVTPASADLILSYQNPTLPSADQSEKLRGVVRSVLGSVMTKSTEPGLKGAQGHYTFFAKPQRPASPLRLVVRADQMPGTRQVADFFPRNLFAEVSLGGRLQVESRGTNQFDVLLSDPTVCAAADYLACTDQLVPDLDLIRSGLQRAYARRDGDYEHSWAVPIQNFVTIRTVVQILAQRAQCELLLGDPEAALREMTLLHDMTRLLAGKPVTLVAAMINVAVNGLYAGIIADGLRLHAWGEPQLAALQPQLEEIRLLGPLVEAIDTERASACHMFETIKPSALGGILSFGPEQRNFWQKMKDPSSWWPRGWAYQNMAAIARGEQSFVETIDAAKGLVTPHLVDEASRKVFAGLNHYSPYNVLARIAIPNCLKACQTTVRNQTMINLALVACALERYWLAHGEYPESLTVLPPQFINDLPRDVINGQPLKYRRVDKDHFVLYSVGWNERDDGGVTAKTVTEGDWLWGGS